MTVPPGWYPDPAEPTTRRYWDGEQWLPDETSAQASDKEASDAQPGEASMEVVPIALASLGARLGARLIDFAVLFVLFAAVNGYFILELLDEVMPAAIRAGNTGQVGGVDLTARAERLSLTIIAITLALWLAYEVPSLINTGQTLGKRVLGIRVVTVSAQPARAGNAFRRWGVTALPLLLPLACGFPLMLLESAWCLWDRPLRQSLHDKLGQTIVIDLSATSAIEDTKT